MLLELSKYKNILWDFDGVILDSMKVRDLGFELIFKDFDSKKVNELLDFHRQNAGWSRYVKIEYFFKNIMNMIYDEDLIKKYANDFSVVMRKELIKKKYLIHDSLDFIKQNSKKYNFHIVSGSDHVELNFLCDYLGIDSYFLSIQGSPTPKTKLVKDVLTSNSYKTSYTCLIGDSINDYDASKANNIRFFGYNNLDLNTLDKYIKSFSF